MIICVNTTEYKNKETIGGVKRSPPPQRKLFPSASISERRSAVVSPTIEQTNAPNTHACNSENNNKNSENILPARNKSPLPTWDPKPSCNSECTTPHDILKPVVTIQTPVNDREHSRKLSHKSSFAPKSLTNMVSSDAISQEKGSAMQTGLDRYINFKRKLSPQKIVSQMQHKHSKLSESDSSSHTNRFAILATDEENCPSAQNIKKKGLKPPPIYLREQCSKVIVNEISHLIGNKSFHVVPIRKGTIQETKIQIYEESMYRTIVAFLDKNKKNYYTYQPKSSKGLVIVEQGIESNVNTITD